MDPDSQLYLRWLNQGLLQGKLLAKDLYLSFPIPFEIQLSPVYREFLYRTSLLLYLINPTAGTPVEIWLGIIPPLSGVLLQVLILVSLFLRKAPFALVAFTGFSAIPGSSHFMTFDYMQLDHHWLEVSCIALWLILGDVFYDRQMSLLKVAGGFVIAVFIGTWAGSPQFVGIIFGFLLIQWVFDCGNIPALFEYFSSSMLIGAGIMAAFLLKHPELAADTAFSGFGWVQIGLIALAGIVVFAFENARKYWPETRIRRVFVILAVSIVGIGFVYLAAPRSLEMAANFFSKRSRVIQSIAEMRPILDISQLAGIHGQLSIQLAFWGVLPLFLALPLLWLSDGKQARPGRLLVAFGIVAYLLSLYQIRFSRWLAPAIPLLTGVIYYKLYNILCRGMGQKNYAAAGAVVFPLLLFQIGIDYSVAKEARNVSKIALQGITWLRDKTPVTSGYSDENEPEYGVVCFWDQGNAITYLARRPVAVANTLVGFKNMAKVFFAKDEVEAFRFCRQNKYRYLYLTALPGEEEYFRYLKGLAEESGDAIEFDLRGDTALGTADETWKSLYFWLYGSLGLKKFGREDEVARHFRIVFVSTDGVTGKDSSMKIVEVVSGARLVGSADPGSAVRLALTIRFGKAFMPYVQEARADASGTFRLTVPYSTKSCSGGIQTDTFYSLSFIRSRTATTSQVIVPEAAVLNGTEIAVR